MPGTTVVAVFNRRFNPAAPADSEHPLVIHMSIVVTIQFIFKPAVPHLGVLFMDILNQISNTFILGCSRGQFAC